MDDPLTYDPVLDSQALPRMRLLSPLRPPQPGRALVLVPDSGPALTVRPGEDIRDARFGAYQSMFTVDTTEHRLVLSIDLLSRDATFAFRSRVELIARVIDPAEVVARGIRDMSGALYGHMKRMLRKVSRDYDIAEFHDAEEALNATVRDFTGDSAIRLRNIHVELLVDEEEVATSGREFRDVVRETRLNGMRRKRHVDMLREDGYEGLIAEIMDREGPRAALEWVEKGRAEEREARLHAMRMVLERGDGHREPFEQAELERAVIDEVLGGDGSLGGGRRGRLRGSLTAGTPGTARPEGPTDRKADGRGEDDPAEPERRGALRGEVLRKPGDEGPPEDEPVTEPSSRRPEAPRTPKARPSAAAPDPGPGSGGSERRVSRVRGVRPPGGGKRDGGGGR
ncbi:hypothetical protein [Streptomyces botrytidirepellens]|uniref:Band 7 domain-containing protein n=1 Tax=Streptomyces botrytidirepellens TaxID=2486417 RepID=A0A3M8VWM7_9ACTN|nr:hypothetical protein [Streptomyces botrytidirepellens]RNG20063.1 hypothetical protein EEJ42_24200 [Streptomyces botrytidirepellens]